MRVTTVVLAALFYGSHGVNAAAPESPTPANPNVVQVSAPAGDWMKGADFDRRISLNLDAADLEAAVDALARASGLSLVAVSSSAAKQKVTLRLKDAPLRDVMLTLARLYRLYWHKTGSVYSLGPPVPVKAFAPPRSAAPGVRAAGPNLTSLRPATVKRANARKEAAAKRAAAKKAAASHR